MNFAGLVTYDTMLDIHNTKQLYRLVKLNLSLVAQHISITWHYHTLSSIKLLKNDISSKFTQFNAKFCILKHFDPLADNFAKQYFFQRTKFNNQTEIRRIRDYNRI